MMDIDDDESLKFAYKEWKLIYGKQNEGDNETYFRNFKVNYKALMAANLKARSDAEQRRLPIPKWMSLNEYGDHSMEEYEAVQRGEDPRRRGGGGGGSSSSTSSTSSSGTRTTAVNGIVEEKQDQFGRPIRSTQVLQQPDQQQQQRGTQVVRTEESSQQQQQQQQSRGTQVISQQPQQQQQRGTQVVRTEEDSQQQQQQARGTQVISQQQQNGQSSSSSSEYQDQFGRTIIRATQPVQQSTAFQTIDEFAKYDNQGTRVIRGDSITNGIAVGTQVGGTQVVRQEQDSSFLSSSSSPPLDNSGTLVIKGNKDDGGRGTVVIARSSDDADDRSAGRGTQVIQSTSSSSLSDPSTTSRSSGTQVISTSSSPNGSAYRGMVYGTTAIQSATPSNNNNNNNRYGTQVIQSTGNSGRTPQTPITATSGTLVISQKDTNVGATIQISPPSRGDNNEVNARGTIIIPNVDGSDEKYSNNRYNDDDDDSEVDDDQNDKVVGGRGTMVIKRQILEPRSSRNLFSILMGSDNTIDENNIPRGTMNMKGEPVKVPPVVETMASSTSNTTSKGLFDFFVSATQKIDTSSRNIGTTKVVGNKRPMTQSTTDDETSVESERKPNVFSFFGGKPNSDSSSRSVRGTILIQKDGKNALQAAQDIGRKTILIPKKESEVGNLPSILSFFGGAKKITNEEAVRDPSARPTLIIKKPTKPQRQFWSPFSAVESASVVSENSVSSVKKDTTQGKVKSKSIVQPSKAADVSNNKVCAESNVCPFQIQNSTTHSRFHKFSFVENQERN
jgi:hypothetical protein